MAVSNDMENRTGDVGESDDPLSKVPAGFPRTHARFSRKPSRRALAAMAKADETEEFNPESLQGSEGVRQLFALIDRFSQK